MAMFVVIKIALLSIVMAQQPVGGNNYADGLWYHLTPARSPFLSSSTSCLLQSHPLVRRDDYNYTPGIGGHKINTRAATWNEARRTCEEESGHLAIINTIAEANVITSLFEKAGAIVGALDTNWAHIGFHDLYQEGEYITIHGQSLARAGYSTWATNQPDNAFGGENCGCVGKDGGLNDVRCLIKLAFICEIPMY